jgi:sugar O-acyltransferase (sialic acid O-acetyltransferase NeuD family)
MAGNSKPKLVIIGDGETAELAYDYFTDEGKYDIVGFSAEEQCRKNHMLLGLPVVPLEEIEKFYDPQIHRAFVAVSFTQLNRLRARLLDAVKRKGYASCSYVSPNAFIGNNVEIGENCFLFEGTTVQRGAKIGNNVMLWTGSIVGHRSIIHDNCFLAAHVAVSGFCTVGENCFLGVNSCVGDNVKVAKDCVVGAGAVIIKDTSEGQICVGNPARPLPNKNTNAFILGEKTI